MLRERCSVPWCSGNIAVDRRTYAVVTRLKHRILYRIFIFDLRMWFHGELVERCSQQRDLYGLIVQHLISYVQGRLRPFKRAVFDGRKYQASCPYTRVRQGKAVGKVEKEVASLLFRTYTAFDIPWIAEIGFRLPVALVAKPHLMVYIVHAPTQKSGAADRRIVHRRPQR